MNEALQEASERVRTGRRAGPSRVPRSVRPPGCVRAVPTAVPWWSMPGTRLPMFPLSAVLFPHASMPLHVFEPRYRELMRDCLAGDARFGIVLIERGSEVGGGDERSRARHPGRHHRGGRAARRALGPAGAGRGADRGGGVAARRPLPGGAGARSPAPEPAGTPGRSVGRPGSGSAGPGPCWRSRAAHRPWPPGSRSTAAGTCEVAAWQLCAAAPLSAYDAQRLLAADGAPHGAPAAPGRVDGGARARPAPHAAPPSDRGPVARAVARQDGPAGVARSMAPQPLESSRRACSAAWPPRSPKSRLASSR